MISCRDEFDSTKILDITADAFVLVSFRFDSFRFVDVCGQALRALQEAVEILGGTNPTNTPPPP